MSTSEFGSELRKLGLPSTMDPAALTSRALEANRKRIRRLARITILLWILDIVLIPSVMLPLAAKFKQLALVAAGQTEAPVNVETLARIIHDVLENITMVSTAVITMMTLASLFAAISTVWLVLTVRRVTLEQMAMGRAQISEQLRRLEPPRP